MAQRFKQKNLHNSYNFSNFAFVMQFRLQLDILSFIFKGMLIGIIASAPMGPIGVLCVQRTLNKGRWFGFVTGIGAAFSDMIYALLSVVGMGLVMDFISNQQNKFYLQIAGSLMLLGFGIYTYRTDPTRNIRKPGKGKGTLVHNGITAFFVTLSNPLIIFLFLACYAQFAFVLPDHPAVSRIVVQKCFHIHFFPQLPTVLSDLIRIGSNKYISPVHSVRYGLGYGVWSLQFEV